MKFDYPPKQNTEDSPNSPQAFLSNYKNLLNKGLIMGAMLLASNFTEAQTSKETPVSIDKNMVGKIEATTKEFAKIDTLFSRVMKTFSYFKENEIHNSSLPKSQELFSKLTVLDSKELDKVMSYVDTIGRSPDQQYILSIQKTKDENGLDVVTLIENKGDTIFQSTLSYKKDGDAIVPILRESTFVGKSEKPEAQNATAYPQNFDTLNKIFRGLEKTVKPALSEVQTLKLKNSPDVAQN